MAKCVACTYFKPGTSTKKLVDTDGNTVRIGKCRRYPPRAPYLGDLSTWPPVEEQDYCGEFKDA